MVSVEVPENKIELPRQQVPPHWGFGSPEDAERSVHALVPKPPKSTIGKLMQYGDKQLRFRARMALSTPEDADREFTVCYRLAKDHLGVFETVKPNSGESIAISLAWHHSKGNLRVGDPIQRDWGINVQAIGLIPALSCKASYDPEVTI